MIRYEAEVQGKTKRIVGCEGTMEEAIAYVKAMTDAGVEIINTEYFNNEERIADIKAGRA